MLRYFTTINNLRRRIRRTEELKSLTKAYDSFQKSVRNDEGEAPHVCVSRRPNECVSYLTTRLQSVNFCSFRYNSLWIFTDDHLLIERLLRKYNVSLIRFYRDVNYGWKKTQFRAF